MIEFLLCFGLSMAICLTGYSFGYSRARKIFETLRARNGQFMRVK